MSDLADRLQTSLGDAYRIERELGGGGMSHVFLAKETAVRKLGFDTRFMRIWEFYLAYCEAAFATRNTSVVQFTLQRD